MTTERMLDIEIEMELKKIGMCIQILKDVNTEGLLREFSYNDAIGSMLDPTGWMRIHDNASKNERVVRALSTFMTEVRKAWPEIDNASNQES